MPGSCICSGLPVANCLRQLCPLGTRSLSAQASACGSRTVGCPEFIRGIQFRPLGRNSLTTFRGQTALRGCPRPRFASLTRREKALYCPFLKEGVRNVARSTLGLPTWTFVRARAHSNPLSKRARLFPSAAYRRSAPPQLAVGSLTPCGASASIAVGGGQAHSLQGMNGQRVRRARAMRPVAEWRSALAKRQGAAPDRRAARPVAERR